jgi:hypothetical protein
MATTIVTKQTTPVDRNVASRVGQVTRLNSDCTPFKKLLNALNIFTVHPL